MASTTPETRQSDLTLEIRRTFAAPRERIFDAWTRAEELRKWFAPGPLTTAVADVDLRVGGTYVITMRGPDGAEHTARGVYRSIEPPHRLVFTWAWDDKPGSVETLVTVELIDRGGSTEIVLRQEGLPSEKERAEHDHGWAGCLEKLQRLLR